MPDVSVIMPVHNAARFLVDAVESVQQQTFDDLEILLVDDASTDDSLDIARRLAGRDGRIRILSLADNAGAAVARNTGIDAARGRYIAFLDSDDLWLPDKLQCQIDYMRESGAAFVCSAYERVDEAGHATGVVRPPARITYAQLLKANRIGCLTAVYDTQRLGKVRMPPLRKRQDYGLWLRLLRQVDAAHCLPEVLARYRVRTGSISSNKVEMVQWHWRLFREVERLPVHRALYYLGHNILRKLFA